MLLRLKEVILSTKSHLFQQISLNFRLSLRLLKVFCSRQPKVDDRGGGGRSLNGTSISDDFEKIFCVSDLDHTPPTHDRTDRKICCVSDIS